MSKSISTKGCWADDDEGDEPEDDAEDSRPLWSEEVGGFCEVGLQLRYWSWDMIGENRDIYELNENISSKKSKEKDIK